MGLNKRRRHVKWVYDGEKIIKIGKQELYPRVYRKFWNLSQYDTNILEKYNLKKAIYNYVGYSNEIYQSERHSKWFGNIRSKHHVNQDIITFLFNLERFYREELKYSDTEINQNIKPKEEILCRCESIESAKKQEKYYTGHYHSSAFFGETLEDYHILLSDKDSSYRSIEKDGIRTLIAKY